MSRPKRKVRPQWWSWPSQCTPSADYNQREQLAVAAHPMYTGLGIHPKTVTDEAWIASVLKVREILVAKYFWEGWIELLKGTTFLWVHQTKPIIRPGPGRELMKTLIMPTQKKWEASFRLYALDPSYAGVTPYGECWTSEEWARGAVLAEEIMSRLEVFTCILENMKKEWPMVEKPVEESIVL